MQVNVHIPVVPPRGKMNVLCPFCTGEVQVEHDSSGIFRCCWCQKVCAIPNRRPQADRSVKCQPSMKCAYQGCDAVMFYTAGQKMIRCPACKKALVTPQTNPGGLLPAIHRNQRHNAQLMQMQQMNQNQAQNYARNLQNVQVQSNLHQQRLGASIQGLYANSQENQKKILMLQQQLRQNGQQNDIALQQQLAALKNEANRLQYEIQLKNTEMERLKKQQQPQSLPPVNRAQYEATVKKQQDAFKTQQAELAKQQEEMKLERANLDQQAQQAAQANNAEAAILRAQLAEQQHALDKQNVFMNMQKIQLEEANERSIAQEAELQTSNAEWDKERSELMTKRQNIMLQLQEYKRRMDGLPMVDKLDLPTGESIEFLTGEEIEVAYATFDTRSANMGEAQIIQEQYLLLLQQQALIDTQTIELELQAQEALQRVNDSVSMHQGMAGTIVLAWSEEEVKKRDEKIEEFFSGEMSGFKVNSNRNMVDTAKLTAKFKEMDVDGDGLVSMQHLVDFLLDEGLDDGTAKRHVLGFCRMVDFGTDENIDFNAFTQELDRMQMYILMQSIKTSFAECDKDKNGGLDREEFCDLLEKHYGSSKRAKEMTDQLFDKVDMDRNGTLSLKEVALWYFSYEVNVRATQEKLRTDNSGYSVETQAEIAMKQAELVHMDLADNINDEKAKKKSIMRRRQKARKQKLETQQL